MRTHPRGNYAHPVDSTLGECLIPAISVRETRVDPCELRRSSTHPIRSTTARCLKSPSTLGRDTPRPPGRYATCLSHHIHADGDRYPVYVCHDVQTHGCQVPHTQPFSAPDRSQHVLSSTVRACTRPAAVLRQRPAPCTAVLQSRGLGCVHTRGRRCIGRPNVCASS